MIRSEFDGLMRLLNEIFGGGYGGAGADTWFKILEKYPATSARDAAWQLAETSKTKPRIADLVDAMGRAGIIGGGSQRVEPNGCTFCGGSGWANVEVTPRQMVMMRCMCDRGDRLNHSFRQLTDDILRDRYVNVRGEIRLHDPAEEQRETKLLEMDTDRLIAWCKRGMAALGGQR